MARPLGIKALIPVEVLMASIAIPSGLLFLSDPSGKALGGDAILPSMSAKLPFITDFTAVGLWLLVSYGIVPLVLAWGLFTWRGWALKGSAILGIVEVLWILTEIAMFYDLGFTPMYPLIGGIGVATLALSLLPSSRSYFSKVF